MSADTSVVIYTGPEAEGVELVLPFGASKFCPHGEEVEVPASIVEGLLAQEGNWAVPKHRSHSKNTTKEKE